MKRRKRTSAAAWSELPKPLLAEIARQLKTQSEIRHFRAVCRSWRHSTPLSHLPSPRLPFLTLKLTFPLHANTHLKGKTLTLVTFSVCLIKPTKVQHPPWLATVEEVNSGKVYLRKPLCRTLVQHLPKSFPKCIDLSCFDVTEISKGYYFRDESDLFTEKMLSLCDIVKVVLWVRPSCGCSMDINDYTVFILCKDRTLHAMRLGVENCGFNCGNNDVGYDDDVVVYKGEIYAVDMRGGVNAFYYDSDFNLSVTKVVDGNMERNCSGRSYRKKWLVVSLGKLYLVRRSGGELVEIEVYELNVARRCWDRVRSLGDDMILFVSFDGCFSASVEDLPGLNGNSVVFYRGCFYSRKNYSSTPGDSAIFDYAYPQTDRQAEIKIEVAVYYLPGPYETVSRRFCRPLMSTLLWPPPKCLSQDACLLPLTLKEEVDSESTFSNEYANQQHEAINVSSTISETKYDEHTVVNTPMSMSIPELLNMEENLSDLECAYLDEMHGNTRNSSIYRDSTALYSETSIACGELLNNRRGSGRMGWKSRCLEMKEQVTDVQMESSNCLLEKSCALLDSGIQAAKNASSTSLSSVTLSKKPTLPPHLHIEVNIHGEVPNDCTLRASRATQGSRWSALERLHIRSDLVPTLRNIWRKHGNILAGVAVQNNETVARALESFATIVQTLQGSSGRSLTNSQADYLTSALSYLQFMRFDVDWLVPSVEKALALHKNKSLVDSLAKIDKSRSGVQEMKMKLIGELAKLDKVDKTLVQNRTLVSGMLSPSGPFDLDQCLGDEL